MHEFLLCLTPGISPQPFCRERLMHKALHPFYKRCLWLC